MILVKEYDNELFTYSAVISPSMTPSLWKKAFNFKERGVSNEFSAWLEENIPGQYELDRRGSVIIVSFKNSDAAAWFKLAWDGQQ